MILTMIIPPHELHAKGKNVHIDQIHHNNTYEKTEILVTGSKTYSLPSRASSSCLTVICTRSAC